MDKLDLIQDNVLKYFMLKKVKGIKNKELASVISVSEPAISQYFNYKMKLSKDKEQKMFNYIENK